MWDAWKSRLAEAVDFAIAQGLVKLSADGRVVPAPFTLNPTEIAASEERALASLTPAFNRLAWRSARDTAFLREHLAPAAKDDSYLKRLLELGTKGRDSQPLELAVTRSDYFLVGARGSPSRRHLQVELNTIAASYPGLAGRTAALHRYLLAGTPHQASLIENDPLAGIAAGIVDAFSRFGQSGAAVLMIVQPGERNRFDQRLLEFRLRESGIATVRASLDEIGAEGRLFDGHLRLAGALCAVSYFRAGYGPEDYGHADAWRGRELVEASDTICAPTAAWQLAGSKKIQQVLARGDLLAQYTPPGEAPRLAASFAGLYDLEQPIPMAEGALPAWRAAIEFPDRFVLKPQREGGGHNLFDAEMRAWLEKSSAGTRAAHILMERIEPERHRALMVVEGALRDGEAVSEIGRFGVFLAEGNAELRNQDVGYLVRTKPAESREGGVSAGFGFLGSLCIPRGPD